MALPGPASYQVVRMDLPRHLLGRDIVALVDQERGEFAARSVRRAERVGTLGQAGSRCSRAPRHAARPRPFGRTPP